MNEWIDTYRGINNSFKKKLVFRFGVEAGFFSEYNNLIISILYCLKHSIKFELYSRHANFAKSDGWNDFFVPFVAVNNQDINRYFNLRYGVERVELEYPLQSIIKPRYVGIAYKALYGITYLTQDLWSRQRDPSLASEHFTISALGINQATLVEAARPFINAFWRYNNNAAKIISSIIDTVPLPASYVSIHIRAGDKSSETKTYDYSQYMVLAQQFSLNKKAFILTDDYTVVEFLRSDYSDWEFYTLCDPSERGYHQDDFNKLDKEVKYRHNLRLFAELDIASAAARFIGTYSSNVGMYMGMRIGPERCSCVDFDNWVMW
ncbi:hypothetical protein [Hymenobacter sp. YC55]|uniref:hypothetical protein n=1 Tax=Hymenobacter sp. YC55 TaxID=3034019 RepID=UPI0023FA13C6|nr:hypothetical protein [Hymenobacter sp. YC55]MDF7810193.1 hypothetical protein [Hymenobacter sp. YC55]